MSASPPNTFEDDMALCVQESRKPGRRRSSPPNTFEDDMALCVQESRKPGRRDGVMFVINVVASTVIELSKRISATCPAAPVEQPSPAAN